MTAEQLKKIAAEKAVERIKSNMVVGLGTGSTAYYAIKKIGELISAGTLNNVVAIASSEQSAKLAREFAILLTDFTSHPKIDVTIDGADEVDPQLNVIKGGGGALLREKVLAQNSDEFIVVVDESKLSAQLGVKWALPVEVIPFAQGTEEKFLEFLGAEVVLRKTKSGETFYTDQKNIILDANFGPMEDALALSLELNERAGIVEHGLFLNIADQVIVAGSKGIEIREN